MADYAQHAAEPTTHGTHLSARSAKAIEAEKLFLGPCRFVRAVQTLTDLPEPGVWEVAFAGRSNVGKSSLLNALVNRHGLARTAARPGRTQQLNFFDLGGKLFLVDMPGYGYAKAPKSLKTAWQGLLFDYLRGRPNLRRVLLLLDARVPVQTSDRAVMDLLDKAAVNFQLVLTKIDGTKPAQLAAKQAEAAALARAHTAAHPEVIATSAVAKAGIEALRATLAELLEQ
ncbi:MAG: ribosome biogenesis GTP-binding protein YihA/YsxC [Acidobacteriia bacterium]|nr:YihA family ribosome biogenesis GTP-binding protein [Methyloceanibacter sp.]MBX5472222.1 YihA family ribosome biogenesis GTP-binding protein [Acetobacteraceae bacterium]MCL6490310.1 ribosome biogenesis GTP-binding protein YihA/YsxC [Terriglobia bacterium]